MFGTNMCPHVLSLPTGSVYAVQPSGQRRTQRRHTPVT